MACAQSRADSELTQRTEQALGPRLVLATEQGFGRPALTSGIPLTLLTWPSKASCINTGHLECQIKQELAPEQIKVVQSHPNQLSFPPAFAFPAGDWQQKCPQRSCWRGVSWFCRLRNADRSREMLTCKGRQNYSESCLNGLFKAHLPL